MTYLKRAVFLLIIPISFAVLAFFLTIKIILDGDADSEKFSTILKDLGF